MKKSITVRPCKEHNNWEIEDQNGNVLNKHYDTKDECISAGERLAKESNCDLYIQDK